MFATIVIEKPTRGPTVSPRRRAWWAALVVPLVLGPAWAALGQLVLPGQFLSSWAGLVLLLLLGVCTGTDLARHKVPNWATYPALGWAVALNAAGAALLPGAAGFLGAVGLSSCLLGASVCFAIML